MIVRSRAGQSAIGITMTGAASINVPDTIAVRAKIPRPRTGLTRTSMRSLGIGSRREIPAASDTAEQGSDVLARTSGGARRSRRTGRRTGRGHLRRRRRLGLVLFFHSRLEGFDAFGEITHHSGQFPGAEKDQDNGQDHDPMHQTERTHNDDPGRLTDAYPSRYFCRLHRLVTRSSNSPKDSSPAAVRYYR